MDGWKGVDNTVMAQDYFDVKDNATLGTTTCIIAGTKSLFCGATNAESFDLCFLDNTGTGYGNNWNQGVHTPTYTWDTGTDQATLGYAATYESENAYDFTRVIAGVRTIAVAFIDLDTLVTYTAAGTRRNLQHPPLSRGSYAPVEFVVFKVRVDGGYSTAG
jgi:hypothetical protein